MVVLWMNVKRLVQKVISISLFTVIIVLSYSCVLLLNNLARINLANRKINIAVTSVNVKIQLIIASIGKQNTFVILSNKWY